MKDSLKVTDGTNYYPIDFYEGNLDLSGEYVKCRYFYIVLFSKKVNDDTGKLKTMNHKPGSVTKNKCFLLLPSILDRPCGTASVQSTRSIGRAALLLLDFAPDEVCHFPAALPLPRWALTPPFHPYPATKESAKMLHIPAF